MNLYVKRFLAAEKAYYSLYKILEYHAPDGVCLADFRSSRKYKSMLKELGEPILKVKNHNKIMMGKSNEV